jgi:hypothetical protein
VRGERATRRLWFDRFNLAGVSWKVYAQDLGGAQPIGSTTFVNDSVPGREDGP